MPKTYRRLLACGLTLLAVIGLSGCSLFAPFVFFYYVTGGDLRVPPAIELREGDEEKPVRLMVLTYNPETLKAVYQGLDRELNEKVSRLLFKGLAADKKKINVIRADRVKKWMDDHPDWKSMEASDVGKAMDADFVICLEIENFRLEKGNVGTPILQGRCDMIIRVVPTDKDSAIDAIESKEFRLELPEGEGRPVTESDMTMRQFRDWFINNLAERISWQFLPHEKENQYGKDRF